MKAGPFDFAPADLHRVERFHVARLERAMLNASHKAIVKAKGEVRAAMASAGLGRLGMAVGQFSDRDKGQGVHRLSGGGFRASAGLSIKGNSERTIGAIRAYTEGANILPVKGQWLWIASSDLQRLVGKGRDRRRLTPALYRAHGLEQKIGPLVLVRRRGGNPILVVKEAGVAASGARHSAKGLTRRGQPRKGQVAVGLIAFVGIPRTSRAQRVDVEAVLRANAALVGDYVYSELSKGT